MTVNRIEVIDHTKPFDKGGGRVYTKWAEDIIVTTEYQDDNRTLKVFIDTYDKKA